MSRKKRTPEEQLAEKFALKKGAESCDNYTEDIVYGDHEAIVECFLAGYRSRDAEVEELKLKVKNT